jgi:hypothetical protein
MMKDEVEVEQGCGGREGVCVDVLVLALKLVDDDERQRSLLTRATQAFVDYVISRGKRKVFRVRLAT